MWALQRREAQELDAGELGALEAHLEECPACLNWTRQERQADEAVARAVKSVPIPAQLAGRIRETLQQNRPRRPQRWLAAAAASVLVGAGVGGYFWLTQPVDLTIPAIAESYISVPTVDAAAEWFAHQGVSVPMPRSLNFDKLNSHGFVTIQGRRVPRLEFFHGDGGDQPAAVAHVLIVDETRFNVEDVAASVPSPLPVGRHTVEVLRETPGFAFIAVYTGGSLHPFLAPQAFQ
jgi:hypothetical protein